MCDSNGFRNIIGQVVEMDLFNAGIDSKMLNQIREARRLLKGIRYTGEYAWVSIRVRNNFAELEDIIADIENNMKEQRNVSRNKQA